MYGYDSFYKCEISAFMSTASVLFKMDEYQEIQEMHSAKHCLTY